MGGHNKIGDVVSDIFNKRKYSNKLNEVKLNNIIIELFGTSLSNYFNIIEYRDNILFIKIDSLELKNELKTNKNLFLEKINFHLNNEVIKDVEIS
tara:strand:+ start:1594 stop:1878 length:285 start_codon:yes stop_codon:yes gene_type:complete